MASKKITDQDFFTREPSEVAKDLLGAVICYKINDNVKRFFIIETEAYYYDEVDGDGKYVCYGAGKTKCEAQKLVSAPLFEKPGTWCVYGGQLLVSVLDDAHSDNVLIKRICDEDGTVYGPNGIAQELHLYKTDQHHTNCHGSFSLSCDTMRLTDSGEISTEVFSQRRVNINSEKKLNYKLAIIAK